MVKIKHNHDIFLIIHHDKAIIMKIIYKQTKTVEH